MVGHLKFVGLAGPGLMCETPADGNGYPPFACATPRPVIESDATWGRRTVVRPGTATESLRSLARGFNEGLSTKTCRGFSHTDTSNLIAGWCW